VLTEKGVTAEDGITGSTVKRPCQPALAAAERYGLKANAQVEEGVGREGQQKPLKEAKAPAV
jgi:hypothetical protein